MLTGSSIDSSALARLVGGGEASGSAFSTGALILIFLRDQPLKPAISLLFGHQTRDVRDIFTFLKTLPDKTCFALDEVHALLSVYRQATSRQAEFLSQLAGLRKRRITIIAGTSQERSVDHGFRGEVDWLYYPTPKRYRPAHKKRAVRRRGDNLSAGYSHLPAWCHINVYAVGPKPWGAGKTLGEDYGLPIRLSVPKARRVRGLTPLNFYQAAALQYTFEDIPMGSDAGTDFSSDDMRAAMRGADTAGLGVHAIGDGDPAEQGPAVDWHDQVFQTDKPIIEDIWNALARTGGTIQQDIGIQTLMMTMRRCQYGTPQQEVEEVLTRWVDYRSDRGVVDM